LPTNVKPLHYDLTLEPDFNNFTFDGKVEIELDVNEASKSVTVNILDIKLGEVSISQDGKKIGAPTKTDLDEEKQRATFTFGSDLKAGSKAVLSIEYKGELNDKLAGFYRSSYKHPDGTTHYLATTQMEPTDARRALPCFDEPALKATYTVTLIADKNLTCLSNMDQASEKEVESKLSSSKKKAVTFNKTPLMSSYLLAFIVGELNVIETNKFRLPVRVYSPPSSDIEHGRFSLELAAKTLEFYEKEFAAPYPLPKMDMVAIPDFSAGAMENWGLVTYRSVDLLFDEKTSGAATKQRVAEVVQHELAHQWFGNLVTMDFWDGLWLNEGFATWMSWYSCNVFYPEWKVWEGYVTDNLAMAFTLDSLRSSHPIEVPVKRADEINEIFDAISYSKGSVVLRMISKYLGEDVFMEGIRRYIKKHAFGNTKTEDLWAALADASGKPVLDVMNTWTKYIGHPVVTVTEDEKNKKISLKQNRFLRTGDVKPEEDTTIFPILLELKTSKGTNKNLTLTERTGEFEVPDLDFYKLNADHSSFFRTLYPTSRLEKLGKAAKEGKLSVEDRAGMLADASSLAAAGYQKTSGVLALIKNYDEEKQYVVWEQILGTIAGLRAAFVFEDQSLRDQLKAFQRQLVSSKAHELGWEFKDGDDHIQSQFKAMLFASAGSAGDEKIIKAAQDLFAKFAAGDKNAIHPNIRGAVYGIALRNGGEKEFDALLNEYKNTPDADRRNTALRSLGNGKTESLRQRALDLSLSDDVKSQDLYLPLANLRSDPEGIDALWNWMEKNWEQIKVKAPPGLSMLSTIVKLCSSNFSKDEQIEKVQKFFADKDKKGFQMALEQALDADRARAGWVKRDRDDVQAYLQGILPGKL